MSDILRQQLRDSVAKELRRQRPILRIVSSNETASDWLMRAGPIAKRLNLEARKDARNGD